MSQDGKVRIYLAGHAVQKVLEPFPCAFQYDILKNGYLAGAK